MAQGYEYIVTLGTDTTELVSQLNQIWRQISNADPTIGLKIDGKDVTKQINDLWKNIEKNVKSGTIDLSQIVDFGNLISKLENTDETIKTIQGSMALLVDVTKELGQQKLGTAIDPLIQKMDALVDKLDMVIDKIDRVDDRYRAYGDTAQEAGQKQVNANEKVIESEQRKQEELRKAAELEKKLSSGIKGEVVDKDYSTKNKTEAFAQLQNASREFAKYYGQQDEENSLAGTKAGYAYLKAYEEALRKGVAESRLEKSTIEGQSNRDKSKIAYQRSQDYQNKLQDGISGDFYDELARMENRLLKFDEAYTEVKKHLGDAPITPEIENAIMDYIDWLELAENHIEDIRTRSESGLNAIFTDDDVQRDKEFAEKSLAHAINLADEANQDYIQSSKEAAIVIRDQVSAEEELVKANEQLERTPIKTEADVNPSNKLVHPSQMFDNEIQQNLVSLENYKNTIKEIDALKLKPDTDETKHKIEELNKLADYFVSQITVIRGENGYDVSPAMMKGNYGLTWNEQLKKYPEGKSEELYKLAVDKSGLQINSITKEFSGIESEIENIESKSEALRTSLTKAMQDSTAYAQGLKSSLITIVGAEEELKIEKNPKWIEAFNKDIDKAIAKFPELENFKNKFLSEDQALDFVKSDSWNAFLSTLPQAQKYLESIGYDFEKTFSSDTTNAKTEQIKEETQAVEESIKAKQNLAKADEEATSAESNLEKSSESLTKKLLSQSEIEEQARKVKDALSSLDGNFKVDVSKTGATTIIQTLKDVDGEAKTITSTFKNATIAIEEFGKESSSAAISSKVSIKDTKKAVEETSASIKELESTQSRTDGLKGIMDTDSYSQMITQLNILQENLNGNKIDPSTYRSFADTIISGFENSLSVVEQTDKAIKKVNSSMSHLYIPDSLSDSFVEAKTKIEQYNSQVKNGEIELAEYQVKTTNVVNSIKSLKSIQSIFDKIVPNDTNVSALNALKETLDGLKSDLMNGNITPAQYTDWANAAINGFKAMANEAKSASKEMVDDAFKGIIDKLKQYETISLRIAKGKAFKTDAADLEVLSNSIDDLIVKENLSEKQLIQIAQRRASISTKTDSAQTSTDQKSQNKNLKDAQDLNAVVKNVGSSLSKLSLSSTFSDEFESARIKIMSLDNQVKEAEIPLVEYKEKTTEILDSLKKMNQVQNIFDKIVPDETNINSLNILRDVLNDLNSELKAGNITPVQYTTYSAEAFNGFKEMVNDAKASNKEIDSVNVALADTKSKLEKLSGSVPNTLTSQFEDQRRKIGELNVQLQNGEISLEDYKVEVNKVISSLEKWTKLGVGDWSRANIESVDQARQAALEYINTLGTMKDVMKGSNVPDSNGIVKWTAQVRTASGELKNVTLNYSTTAKAITATSSTMKTELTGAARVIDAFKKKITDLSLYWSANFLNPYQIIDGVKKAATVTRELDAALTEMRKVSDESVKSLKEYQKTTFDVADGVGTTAKQIQNSTADWMRLGEAMTDAGDSAKASNILLNVSEFDNIDDATESLVSVSQAYKELSKMDIIDVLNQTGNMYSISTDNLARALQDSAAVLKTQGNDLYKSVALITAGNAINQDYSKTAGGVRTISLRLAGTEEAKDELASLGEDVDDFIVQTNSKTQQLIKDYTAVASNAYKGVDVLDSNGNLRDTYSILLDIAKIYKEIQETDKKAGTNRAQALIEAIAGKNRSNIAASILQNPDMLESVYESAKEAEGSAEKELNSYLDSIDGRMAKLQNRFQELASVFAKSDWIKSFISAGTSAVTLLTSLIDKVGSFKIILGSLGSLSIQKLIGLDYRKIHIIRKYLQGSDKSYCYG